MGFPLSRTEAVFLQKMDFIHLLNCGRRGGFRDEVRGPGDSDQVNTPLNRFRSSDSVFEYPGVQRSSQPPVADNTFGVF